MTKNTTTTVNIPKLNPVKSSTIKAIGYDEVNRHLYIEFHSGTIYKYYNVYPQEFNGLITAYSIGGYYNEWIKRSYIGYAIGRYELTPHEESEQSIEDAEQTNDDPDEDRCQKFAKVHFEQALIEIRGMTEEGALDRLALFVVNAIHDSNLQEEAFNILKEARK
jgi:hypothetical protein